MKPAPLGRAVTAVLNNINPNYTVNNPAPKNLTITKEEGRATYMGTLFATVQSSGNVTLRAIVKDISATNDAGTDGNEGDIRHATATFINRDTGFAISPAIPVKALDEDNPQTGEVTYNWPVSLGSNGQTFRIGMRIDNYYTRDHASEDALVTVARDLAAGFARGGGYLTLTTSGGLKAGTPGSINGFGFAVTYKSSGSSPAGHFYTMVRSGGAVYYVKGMTFTSVAVNGKRATIQGRASIYAVTTGSTLIDSAATFEVKITDASEAGMPDQIGITVKNGAGVVWFSSNGPGITTMEQAITAGEIKLP
jgi:hypothetical protein